MHSYNVSVEENVPLGFFVLKVLANDSDTGRNGQVLYSLVPNTADRLFTIDGTSGEIKTVKQIDYETLPSDIYTLKVIAFDNGLPQMSSSVVVYVTILDQNDNCPIFNPLPSHNFNVSVYASPGTVVTNISARDQDSGLNGAVEYNIPQYSNVGGEFVVDAKTGRLMTSLALMLGRYDFKVFASDQGVPQCSRGIDISVTVMDLPTNATIQGKSSYFQYSVTQATSMYVLELWTKSLSVRGEILGF